MQRFIFLILLSGSMFRGMAAMIMQPYLQAVSTNSVYVLVECDTPDTVRVVYGMAGALNDTALTFIVSTTLAPTYVHKVKLDGLLPNTLYYYFVWQEDSRSTLYSFQTAVEPGTAFRFAWMADCRTQTTYHDQIASLIDTYNPSFSLYGGDFCSTSSYAAWKSEFFLPGELNLVSHVPFYAAIGNHETWGQNTQAFIRNPESASGTQDYYSFDYGDVHFLCINNQVSYSDGSAQYNFIKTDLESTTKTWKVVFCHNPAYCAGGHNEDASMVAMCRDIFVQNNVDMVIAGHSHFYQHNYVDGIHHMVIGDAGAPQVTPGYAPYTVLSVMDYEFGMIDVTPSTFTLKIYSNLNNLFDSVKLQKPVPVSGPLGGTRTVGPAPSDFLSLSQAFDYLRTKGNGVSGPLTLELKPEYSCSVETFPLTINSIYGTSEENTITIRPSQSSLQLSLTSNNPEATLLLNNVQFLIIDGRPDGEEHPQLILENQNVTGNAIRFVHDASNNIIRYCTIRGVNKTTSSGSSPGVVFMGSSSVLTGNDNNLIENCSLKNGTSMPVYLIYSKGTTGKENSSVSILKNEFSNFITSGIYLSSTGNGNNWLISGNSFYYDYPSPVTSNQTVIRFGSAQGNNNLITGNYIGGQSAFCAGPQWNIDGTLTFIAMSVVASTVTKNTIRNIGGSQASSSPTLYGIINTGATGITNEFSNNLVSLDGGVAGNPVLYCYYDNSAVGFASNLYHNSFRVSGHETSGSSTYAFYRNYSSTSLLRNNIFSNDRIEGGTGKHYSIYCATPDGLNSDYNVLYSQSGSLGVYNALFCSNLIDWRSTTGLDSNSISFNPMFLSVNDLRIAWDPDLNNKGTPVVNPGTDIDGNIRGNPPDPGINEFSQVRVWTGMVSGDWDEGANWSPVGVPVPAQNILIPAGSANYPVLKDGNYTCTDLTLDPATSFHVQAGCSLNILGDLTIMDDATFAIDGIVVVEGTLYK